METYEDIKRAVLTRNPNDRGFCGPVAISVVTGLPVHDVLDYVEHMRERSGGMLFWHIKETIEGFTGADMDMVSSQYPKVRTMVTAARHLPTKGTFLLVTKDHVAAFKNGQLVDWTHGRRLHIIGIFKVNGV
jgi:hypothetical protein